MGYLQNYVATTTDSQETQIANMTNGLRLLVTLFLEDSLVKEIMGTDGFCPRNKQEGFHSGHRD